MTAVQTARSGGLRSRATWILADSALSSLTNAGLTIGLARVVSSAGYGAFALSFTFFSLAQAISMAINNQVVVIHYAHRDRAAQRRAAALAASGAVGVGLIAAVGLLVLALVLRGLPGVALAVMAVILPALMWQDVWRSSFIAMGRPARAFWLDALWAVAWTLLFALLILVGSAQVGLFMAAWGVGALASAATGAVWARSRLSLAGLRHWFTSHKDVSGPSLANTFATLGASQVAFLLVSAFGGITDIGALRGAQTLLGPLNIIGFALTSFSIPELVRRTPGSRGLKLSAIGMSGVLTLVTVAWGGVLILLPDDVGRELLGDTWTTAAQAIPGMVLFLVFLNAFSGVNVVLRALNRVTQVFRISTLQAPLVIVLAPAGAVIDGARGAALGLALAAAIVQPVAWWTMLRYAGAGRRGD